MTRDISDTSQDKKWTSCKGIGLVAIGDPGKTGWVGFDVSTEQREKVLRLRTAQRGFTSHFIMMPALKPWASDFGISESISIVPCFQWGCCTLPDSDQTHEFYPLGLYRAANSSYTIPSWEKLRPGGICSVVAQRLVGKASSSAILEHDVFF